MASAPDFRLGGIIREVKFETCRTGDESEGWFYIKIDWALYSEREQKVVFQLTTEGLATSPKKIADLSRRGLRPTLRPYAPTTPRHALHAPPPHWQPQE